MRDKKMISNFSIETLVDRVFEISKYKNDNLCPK